MSARLAQALPSGRSDIFEALREVLGEDNAQAPGEAEENEEKTIDPFLFDLYYT